MLGESSEPLPVIETTKSMRCLVCPHCKQEIHEKHSYMDEAGIDHHTDCGGAIKWPPTDWSKVAPEWRKLLGGPETV